VWRKRSSAARSPRADLSFGFSSATCFAIGQTLAGPRAAAKWAGVQNCLGNIAGIVAPVVTGFVVQETGQFFWAFAIACAVRRIGRDRSQWRVAAEARLATEGRRQLRLERLSRPGPTRWLRPGRPAT